MKVKDFIKQKDKQLHFAVCAVVSIFSPEIAIGLAVGKEYGDSKAYGNTWSWGDIVADAMGIVFGFAIKLAVTWYCANVLSKTLFILTGL